MGYEVELPRVLIVDDEPGLRGALSRIMRSHNIEHDQAANGAEALRMLGTRSYHAVLCDIMMPEMTGLECLATAQTQNIITPFIFVTGFADSERMLQAIRLGAIDFISKPFNNEEVVDVVVRAIEIALRRKKIHFELEKGDAKLFAAVMKNEKIISLMRACNNKRRTP